MGGRTDGRMNGWILMKDHRVARCPRRPFDMRLGHLIDILVCHLIILFL